MQNKLDDIVPSPFYAFSGTQPAERVELNLHETDEISVAMDTKDGNSMQLTLSPKIQAYFTVHSTSQQLATVYLPQPPMQLIVPEKWKMSNVNQDLSFRFSSEMEDEHYCAACMTHHLAHEFSEGHELDTEAEVMFDAVFGADWQDDLLYLFNIVGMKQKLCNTSYHMLSKRYSRLKNRSNVLQQEDVLPLVPTEHIYPDPMTASFNPFEMASAPLLEFETPYLYDTFPTQQPQLFETFPSQGFTPLEPFNQTLYPSFPSNDNSYLHQPTYQPLEPMQQFPVMNYPPAYSAPPIVSEYFYPDVVEVVEQPGYSRDPNSTNDEVIEIIEEKVVDVRPIAFGESWKKPEEENLQTGDVRSIISAFEKRLKKVEEDVPRRQIIRRRRRRLIKPGMKLDNGKFQPAQYEYYYEEFEADDKYVFKEGDVVVEEVEPQAPQEEQPQDEEDEKKKGFFDKVLDEGKDMAKDKAKSIIEDILKDLAKKAYKEVEPTFWNKFDEYTDGQFSSLHAPTLRSNEPSFSLPSVESNVPSIGDLPSVGLVSALPTISLPSVGTLSSLPALSNLSLLSGPLSSVAGAIASGSAGVIGSAPGLLTALVASAPAVLNAVSPQAIASGAAYGAVSAAAHAAPGLISGVGSSLLSLSATGLETGIGMISTIGSALPSLSSLRPNFGKPSMKTRPIPNTTPKVAPKTKPSSKHALSKSMSAIEDRIEKELEQILQQEKPKVKTAKRTKPVTRKIAKEPAPKPQQTQPLRVKSQDVQNAQNVQQERIEQLSSLGAFRGKDPEGYTFKNPVPSNTNSIPQTRTNQHESTQGVRKQIRRNPEGYTFSNTEAPQQLPVHAQKPGDTTIYEKPVQSQFADTKTKKKKAKKQKKEKPKKASIVGTGKKIVKDIIDDVRSKETHQDPNQSVQDTTTSTFSEQPITYSSSQINTEVPPSYSLPNINQPDLNINSDLGLVNFNSPPTVSHTGLSRQLAKPVPDVTSGTFATNQIPSNAGIASMMNEPVIHESLLHEPVAPRMQSGSVSGNSINVNQPANITSQTTRVVEPKQTILQRTDAPSTDASGDGTQESNDTNSLGLIDAGKKLMKDMFGKTRSSHSQQSSSGESRSDTVDVHPNVVTQQIILVNDPIEIVSPQQPGVVGNTVSQTVTEPHVKTHDTQHSLPTLPSISVNELLNDPNTENALSGVPTQSTIPVSNTQVSTQTSYAPTEVITQDTTQSEQHENDKKKTSSGIIDAGMKFVHDVFGKSKSKDPYSGVNDVAEPAQQNDVQVKTTIVTSYSVQPASTVKEQVTQALPVSQHNVVEIESNNTSPPIATNETVINLGSETHVLKSVPVTKFVHQSSEEVPTKSVLIDEVAPSTHMHHVSTDECEIRDTQSPSSAVTTSQYTFAPTTSSLSNFVSRPIMTESTQPFSPASTVRTTEPTVQNTTVTTTNTINLNEGSSQPGHHNTNSGISGFLGSIKRAFTRDTTRTDHGTTLRQPSDVPQPTTSPVVKDVNRPVEQTIKNPIELIAQPFVEHRTIEIREQKPMVEVRSQSQAIQPQVVITEAEPTVQKVPTTEIVSIEASADSHTPSEVIIEGSHPVTTHTVMQPTFGWQPTVSAENSSAQPLYTIQPRENLPRTDSEKRRGMTNNLQNDVKLLQNSLPAPSPYSPVPINSPTSNVMNIPPSDTKVMRVMSPGAVAPHDIVTSTVITQETTTALAPEMVSTKRNKWDNFLLLMNTLSVLAWFTGAAVNIVGSSLFLGGDQFSNAVGILYIIGFSLWAAAATIAFVPPLVHPFVRSSWVGADITFALKSYDIVNCFATAGIMASMTLFIIGAALWLSSTAGLNQATMGIWVAAGSLWLLSTFVRDFALRRESGDIRSKLSIFMRAIAADMMLVASVLFLLGAILFMVRYNNFSINSVTAKSFGVGAGILWIVGGATVATSAVTQAIAQR